jgi:ferredoxin--NADP+ reductase
MEKWMAESTSNNHSVAVLGAGPAGLFAARELAQAGVHVALINRDIKPGGLAEYGIYPDKYKMKDGLRRQFRQVLDEENIHYFGNLTIGAEGEFDLDEIRALGFDAMLVTVGAQGTKWLGMPGEELDGVYHAKDLVYHYNQLPPFSQQRFALGKRILCVGVGNVMLDIAHWAVRELKVEELIAIARRGPADVKFTKKEMETVGRNLDLAALEAEFERTSPIMEAVGQDAQAAKGFILSALDNALEPNSNSRLTMDFLVSPNRILGDAQGRVRGVEVEDTTLELRNRGGTRAVGLGTTRVIECDTVIFCIGDRVDDRLGLPLDKWGEFAKHPQPRFPVEEISYEAYDPQSEQALEGVFLAGWAREASSGLVGTARKDGINGAKAVLAYLGSKTEPANGAVEQLEEKVKLLQQPAVRKADWTRLEDAEAAMASELGLPEFKYPSNQEMLAAIGMLPEKA